MHSVSPDKTLPLVPGGKDRTLHLAYPGPCPASALGLSFLFCRCQAAQQRLAHTYSLQGCLE